MLQTKKHTVVVCPRLDVDVLVTVVVGVLVTVAKLFKVTVLNALSGLSVRAGSKNRLDQQVRRTWYLWLEWWK